MQESIDIETTLELLADPYARELLHQLGEEPISAPELDQRCSFSRTTVYRRLDQLEEAGLIEATLELRRSGNHRKIYRPAVEEVSLSVSDDGLEGAISQIPQTV